MAANPTNRAARPGPKVIHRQNRVVHYAAIVVAVAIAVVSPVVFAILGYMDTIELRQFQAELTARQVAIYAYVQGPTWRFSEHRVAELVRQIAPAQNPGRQIIAAKEGGAPIIIGADPAFPVARTSMPIIAGAETVGTVTVEITLRPLLLKIAAAVVVGVILAFAAYACVRFPLIRLGQAIDALRASEAQFRSLAAAAPMGIAIKDLNGRFQWVNDEMLRRTNAPLDDLIGRTVHDIYPQDMAYTIAHLDSRVMETREPQIIELNVRSANGDTVPELNVRFPILDGDGNLIGLGSINLDISAQRMAEDQLRQAQRLQAIGQLTGGVAHDFNNLLQVIETNLGLARDLIPDDSKATTFVEIAATAGRRGAELTRKLLAFSRQQILRPERLDINAWIRNEIGLLTRTLGEDVTIRTDLHGPLSEVIVDEGNLTNAVLNLAINARAAMPKGGTLTFATGSRHFDNDFLVENDLLAAGDYIEIAVADTGCGMTRETRSHAFEPFFSTKGFGEGSGLGLSMVYGFTRQSGGTVSIESEVGQGTTVRILLPSAEDRTADGQRDETETPRPLAPTS